VGGERPGLVGGQHVVFGRLLRDIDAELVDIAVLVLTRPDADVYSEGWAAVASALLSVVVHAVPAVARP